MPIKVIDIFAGPGGLSEGFAAVRNRSGEPVFAHRLSIEMEPWAFETLKLRTFYRAFSPEVPADYYRCLRQEIGLEALYEAHPSMAKEIDQTCWNARLGPDGESPHTVRKRIQNAIGSTEDWVLIGGPPCQAYSLAGRSRNKGNPEYDPNNDVRQRLYVEYLQILADHRPAAFIMENVKGLLSATVDNQKLFVRILEDLRNPAEALKRENRTSPRGGGCGYRIFSLVKPLEFENGSIEGAVIKAEEYGIPQARHRVILLGIRDDLRGITPHTLKPKPMVSMNAVVGNLPALRSGLSRARDSAISWEQCLRSQVGSRWANAGTCKADSPELSAFLRSIISEIRSPAADRGSEFLPCESHLNQYSRWYSDTKIGGVCNHSTRGHMEKDLYRYVYAACFAQLRGHSPSLQYFPADLLPLHSSAESALANGSNFSDRFRVQVAGSPSTTVMSHISKDGHYYIHPDPRQCRSLTVREAARLQTFPDNYFFCGPRTAQYTQVGNAVPPLLAKQIAEIVHAVLLQGGTNI